MTSTNQSLFEQSQRLIPGGVNSPVRAFRSVGGTPVFFKKGLGSRLWDVDGKEYIPEELLKVDKELLDQYDMLRTIQCLSVHDGIHPLATPPTASFSQDPCPPPPPGRGCHHPLGAIQSDGYNNIRFNPHQEIYIYPPGIYSLTGWMPADSFFSDGKSHPQLP
jgi:hypothetical protein